MYRAAITKVYAIAMGYACFVIAGLSFIDHKIGFYRVEVNGA